MNSEMIPPDYGQWLESLKVQITASRSRAALAVNSELIQLYHRIGTEILQRQTTHGWGTKIIQRIADDLKAAFPDMKGFSTRNLKYMRYFAEHCPLDPMVQQPAAQFGQQPAAQLPWFHIVTILTKAEPADREWYALQAVTQGWSRLTLEQNLKSRLHERQGNAVSNFSLRLPAPDSALAIETLKDPYLFDFLGLADDAHEREIENALIRLPEYSLDSVAIHSANGAICDSPGQRPGYRSHPFFQALKGRRKRYAAPSGRYVFLSTAPKAMPWAITVCPFGAGEVFAGEMEEGGDA